jgi:hypothetical protein
MTTTTLATIAAFEMVRFGKNDEAVLYIIIGLWFMSFI